jgi:polyferredoxin
MSSCSFFLLIGYIAVGKALSEIVTGWTFLPDVSLHAICPFGGVVTLYNLITDGRTIQKVHESAVVLAALSTVLAIVAGPVLCGWVCPLGTVQDWISHLGKKIFKRKYNTFVPDPVHKVLRWSRYGVLLWVVYATAASGKLVFDLWIRTTHSSLWTSEVAWAGVAILVITLVASLFVARPWCKYACPYGALLGLFNKIRIFSIRRDAGTCIDCKRCDRACPMNITVSTAKNVRDAQCISCLECTSARSCPVDDTVDLAWAASTHGKEEN